MGKYESRRENAEVEKAYRQVTGTPAPKKGAPPPRRSAAQRAAEKKKKMMILIIVCAAVLTLLIGLIVGLIIHKNRSTEEETIRGGVYAGSINLSGMTLEEAKNALHLATDDTFTQKDMVIKLPDGTIKLSPADTKAKLDVDAVAQAAFDYGRKGNSTGNIIPLLPYLKLELDYIQSTIEEFCSSHSSVMVQPTVTIEGDRPAYDSENPDLQVKHQTLTIKLGVPEYVLDSGELYDQVLEAYSMNTFSVQYKAPQQKEPNPVNAQVIFDELCLAPKDAEQDPDTLDITPEVYGYGFDVAKLQQMIDEADYGETITITLEFLTPSITTETITGGVVADLLAQATATGSMNNADRDSNIATAVEKLNGLKIKPGATFSFNEAVGTLSLRNGFKDAPISLNNGDAMGGGVSQVASALYRCALLADLKVTERHCHAYAVDFADLGLDAFVDGKTKDLCFRNNTGGVIDIEATYQGGTVTVKLMGTGNLDYTVELVVDVQEQLDPQTVLQQMTEDNVKGYKDGDIIQEGIVGYKVQVMVNARYADSDEVNNLFSISSEYASRDKIEVNIDSGEDPGVDDPSVDDPSVDDPSVDDPSVDDPSVDDPSVDDPSVDPPAETPDEEFLPGTDDISPMAA